jgi:carboxypeptidase PM20D1
LLAVGAVVIAIAAVVTVRTQLLSLQRDQIQSIDHVGVDKEAIAQHLSRAVQFATVSNQDPKQLDAQAFTGFHAYLREVFPNLHKAMLVEPVGEYSLLYTLKGSDPSLDPVLLLAHQDVVPVAPGTEARWTQPAFSGRIADGFIWGRGTMDDKGSLMAVLEAVELLLKEGFQPKRTLYLAFGHDEEVAGTGASQIAALLAARGVKADYLLDEGGQIVEGLVTGVSGGVALVGTAEKGYASVELSVAAEGGHSSMPPRHTAIGVLGHALYRLEQHQMPSRLTGLTEQMLTSVAPAAAMPFRAIFANTWLFGPAIVSQLGRSPSSNAMIRTTTAETIVQGGVKENVLPSEARAVVNFRILPGDTVQTVAEHVRSVIDDPQVTIAILPDAHDPSIVSSTDTDGFRNVRRTIYEVFPEVAAVSPYLVLGATDSRRYQSITHNIYRFTPTLLQAADLERIHGTNERLSVEAYARSVTFFAQLIRNSTR